MSRQIKFIRKERQPNPEPPDILSSEVPSLGLYFILILIAFLLITVSFIVAGVDWPALLLNLASEIIGAIIILVIVDRRLRQSEIVRLQEYATAYSVRFSSFFSKDVRTTISYSKILLRKLLEIQPRPYLERQSLEQLPSKYPKGFILIGPPGSGKSTFVQTIAIQRAQRVLRQPKLPTIPLLFPVRSWRIGESLENQILREINRYTRVDPRIMQRWLDKNRILLIFDGLDEHQQPELALIELENFRKAHPAVVTIGTCRDKARDGSLLLRSSLPVISMPSLTDSEIEKLMEIQEQQKSAKRRAKSSKGLAGQLRRLRKRKK